jgi:hypothetical protein
VWSTPYPRRFTRYPLYRRLSDPQGQSGRVWKICPTGIRSPGRQARNESHMYRANYITFNYTQQIHNTITLYITTVCLCNVHCYTFRQFHVITRQFTTSSMLQTFCKLRLLKIQFIYGYTYSFVNWTIKAATNYLQAY